MIFCSGRTAVIPLTSTRPLLIFFFTSLLVISDSPDKNLSSLIMLSFCCTVSPFLPSCHMFLQATQPPFIGQGSFPLPCPIKSPDVISCSALDDEWLPLQQEASVFRQMPRHLPVSEEEQPAGHSSSFSLFSSESASLSSSVSSSLTSGFV